MPLLRRCFYPLLVILLVISPLLTGCDIPRVSAEDRLFLNLSVDFLGEYQLPKLDFEGAPVGGISAIAYDVNRDRLYALSDDHSRLAPARFYTLKLNLDTHLDTHLDTSGQPHPKIRDIEVEKVTLLKQANGEPYLADTIDPEGIALSPRQTVFITSEGVSKTGSPPFIGEYTLETGQLQSYLQLPERYLPDPSTEQTKGVQANLGLESLTLNTSSATSTWVEPFRLFTATESALLQDLDEDPAIPPKNRFLHYLIGEDQSTLIAEYLYPMELAPFGAIFNGLTELMTLDQGGHFLGLERAFGLKGFSIKLFQLATGAATDISTYPSLKGDTGGIAPIRKRLLLDLESLDIPLDNLEGVTRGPKLPDGDCSLLLVSDDNFNPNQVTQFMLFRLKGIKF